MGWMSLVAAGFKAIGDISSGIASERSANYNAQVARNNAVHATEAGEAQAMNVSLRGAQQVGRAKTVYGANNVTLYQPGRSSVSDVLKSGRMASQVNTENTLNNALVTAYGYNAQSTLDKYQGRQALIGSVISAGSDIAGGVGEYYGGAGGGGGESGGSSGPSSGSALGSSLQESAAPGGWAGPDDYSTVRTG